MKGGVAGTASTMHLAMIHVSLIVLAIGSLLVCLRIFERESTIFRA